ncbi:MAG: RNA 2',3'-cyclic phosphodiesterase [bacterium]|nr:RNA 2',3'-cyclic phosphodiesterase [bacterium]
MRIFTGIKLDAQVLDDLDKFLEPFKEIDTPLRWTWRDNRHLTLKYIGDVSPKDYARVVSLMEEADLNVGTFDLTLAGCGKFGKKNALNIFWIGVEKKRQLEELFNKIEITLEEFGIEKEQRDFRPHITMARNKKNFNFKPFLRVIEQFNEEFIATAKVAHFQIYQSELTPGGPIYTILKEFPIDTA